MKKLAILLLLLSFIGLMPMGVADEIKVYSGLKIPVRVEEKQTSKNVLSGANINLEVASDVVFNDVLVFKKGNRATLNISDTKKAGFLGHAGKISITDGEVFDNNGVAHTLDFRQNYIGEEKTYPKVLLTASVFFLFPLALLGL